MKYSNLSVATALVRFSSFALCLLLFSPPSVRAEIYQGIEPNATLQEIKARFPNANYKPVKAAWVTADKAFYLITGSGLVGDLYVAFYDERPASFTSMTDAKAAGNEILAKFYLAQWEKGTDESLSVQWVRWVPPAAIPVERFFGRYGKPVKVEFNDSDMAPYYQWKEKGVLTTLTDDFKKVVSVEYGFTKAEWFASCKKKYDLKICEKFYGN